MESSKEEQRIVIVHESFTQNGGAERVAIEMCNLFPNAQLVTLVVSKSIIFENLDLNRVKQLVPALGGLRNPPRIVLLILSLSVLSKLKFDDSTIVICSSTGWSHFIKSAKKIIYCYSPARWIYECNRYIRNRFLAYVVATFFGPLRLIDKRKASSARIVLSISEITRARIGKFWHVKSEVLHPPIRFKKNRSTTKPDNFPFDSKDFYLTISRPRSYKNTKFVFDIFSKSQNRNLVIVGDSRYCNSTNVIALKGIGDDQLCWLYKNAKAVVAISYEDFGLTPVEGHVFGTPTIALNYGGYLETCVENLNAVFMDGITVSSANQAIERLEKTNWNKERIAESSEKFSVSEFGIKLNDIIQHL